MGKTDYPSEMPLDASRMFGNNVLNLIKLIIDSEGNLNLNPDEEIQNGTLAVHNGKYISPRLKQILNVN